MADRIVTIDGDVYEVLERTGRGDPLRVQHAEAWMRGSFLEARMNMALAVRQVKVAFIAALPASVRHFASKPAIFWAEQEVESPHG